MHEDLLKFRSALHQAYLRACMIEELRARGIHKLLLRALNTTDDIKGAAGGSEGEGH